MFSIFKKKELNNLEKAVIYIYKNHNGSLIGTSFDEISFTKLSNQLILNSSMYELDLVTDGHGNSSRKVGIKRENIEFEINIDEKKFDVHVSIEPNGNGGAILRVRESEDWLDKLYTCLLPLSNVNSIGKFFLPHSSALYIEVDHERELPESIGKLTNLKVLHLNNGDITTLPKSISKLTNLEELDLCNNAFTKLPALVQNFPNLKILKLSGNDIKQWPSEVGNLRNLEELDIGCNNLLTLPDYIINLTKLQRFDMLYNEDLILSEPQTRWLVDLIKNGAEVILERKRYDQLLHDYPTIPVNCGRIKHANHPVVMMDDDLMDDDLSF